MITPDDVIPPDDSDESEMDDQQSQRDVHSNGLDEEPPLETDADADILRESYDASESAHTLHLDDE